MDFKLLCLTFTRNVIDFQSFFCVTRRFLLVLVNPVLLCFVDIHNVLFAEDNEINRYRGMIF